MMVTPTRELGIREVEISVCVGGGGDKDKINSRRVME